MSPEFEAWLMSTGEDLALALFVGMMVGLALEHPVFLVIAVVFWWRRTKRKTAVYREAVIAAEAEEDRGTARDEPPEHVFPSHSETGRPSQMPPPKAEP